MNDDSPQLPRLRFPVGTWILLITLSTGIVASYSVAQWQIVDQNRRVQRLEERNEQARVEYIAVKELLVRIDERTTEIKRKQDAHNP